MKLHDKVIIVTGSTMGIGKAIAERVVAEGGRVLVHGLEQEEGDAVVASLGGKAAFCLGDLADPTVPGDIVACAMADFGRIDGLVNNAGVVLRGRIEDTDVSLWDTVMNINARAPFLMIKAALPHLIASGGSVVNIGSVNAYCGEEKFMVYSASKGALMTLTRNLGDTLHRQGVRVNQINPGWVLTENEIARKREHGMDDDWFTKLPVAFAPAGRILKPEEIAASVVHFLSDELGPVSGTVLELEQYPMIGRNPEKV
jgi:NAD(P)-dependent dehydrogenase (short-subunit alcohol dehydrogenase family)